MPVTATAPSARRPSASAGAWRLVVLHAPKTTDRGTVRVLSDEPMRLGRAGGGEADLELDDAEISRLHATVEPTEDGGWRIRDEGSRNGTFVDGEPAKQADLPHGTVARIGSSLLLLEHVDLDTLQAPPVGDEGLLIGKSLAIDRLRRAIDAVAASAVPVLVLGETGSGKELVAQEVHRRSGRTGDFVPVNCAALPANLVESELFGHTKGAFTGATAPSRGLFGEAEQGTLLLDEIGEMPIGVQAKLLRALATGEVRAVGETRATTADVRIVAATNVSLEDAVEDGRFRGDLLARLMGQRIDVPPLRERRDDIPRLLAAFLDSAGSQAEPTADAIEALLVYSWPFNVRELEQAARAAVAKLGPGEPLDLDHLPEDVRGPVAARHADGAPASTDKAELPLHLRIPRDRPPTAEELEQVLRHFEGNVSRVASFYGKKRRQVYRWAERLELDPSAFRAEE